MDTHVTASMLYDLVHCPHRVTMDLHADPADRDPPNPFVQMLWERGTRYEKEVIAGLDLLFLDLSPFAGEEKERRTLGAMAAQEPLIYSGRIQQDDLLGDPDLLRFEDGGYIAGDIKSGAGEEGPEDLSKPKKHYAVQLALYTDILERRSLSAGHRAFVWDIHGKEVEYDFSELYGVRNPRTLWEDYEEALDEARSILPSPSATSPAYAGICKMCHWFSLCTARLKRTDDLTLIFELGRSRREGMLDHVSTVTELAESETDRFMSGNKTPFPGVGAKMLSKFHQRARLLVEGDQARAYRTDNIQLPSTSVELFFDIEVDPMRDICYLHGFIERSDGDSATERFVYFFADEPISDYEQEAFKNAFEYVMSRQPCSIYYYSKYERTIYRNLQTRYPEICTAQDIEDLFEPSVTVDLYYDVVLKSTQWPTSDYSIKSLAKHLGFNWRDPHPSGAASIEWFDRWVTTRDPQIRQRILDYNEDDCRATRVLLDGIRGLTTQSGVS